MLNHQRLTIQFVTTLTQGLGFGADVIREAIPNRIAAGLPTLCVHQPFPPVGQPEGYLMVNRRFSGFGLEPWHRRSETCRQCCAAW